MAKKKKKSDSVYGQLRDAIVPDQHRFQTDSRYEPQSLARTLTAERLHGILISAEQGNTQELFAVYRDMILGDTHLLAEFSKRKLVVLKQPVNFSPLDPKNPVDVQTAHLVKLAWDEAKGKLDALTHLLDASLYPVSLIERTYRPSRIPGLRFEWGAECGALGLVPVAYHLLDFTTGSLMVQEVDEHSKSPTGRLCKPETIRFITHRGHLLTSIPDNWGGPMRAALFWWLFKTMDRSWWARFLERYGAPFAVAKYEDGRDDTRAQLTRAFQAATKLFGLVVTKGTDVELLQANASQSGDAFEKFKTTADNELSKLVLGATGTTTMTGGGIGGSQADVHNEVRGDYEGFDAIKLAETLQDQLVDPFCQINALPGRCKILIGQEDPGSAEETRKSLKTLKECDLELEEDGIAIVSRRLQLPIRRATTPAPVDAPKPPVKSLSVDEDPRDALVEEFAPGVAKAFGQEAAALLPRPGQTPATYVKELQNSLVSMAPHRSVRALELALQAFCAEGA